MALEEGETPAPLTLLVAIPYEVAVGVLHEDDDEEERALELIRIRMKRMEQDG